MPMGVICDRCGRVEPGEPFAKVQFLPVSLKSRPTAVLCVSCARALERWISEEEER